MEKETEKHIRPSWDDYFMAIVRIVGTRSTCDRLHAGAVLVKDKRIISTGYNGSPPGLPHCDEVGHLMEEGHCVRTVHAEHNTILQAATVSGTNTKGSTMYTKYSPCIHCSKYIVTAGVKRVVMGKVYRNSKVIDYLKEAGIEVEVYEESEEWQKQLQELFKDEIEVMKPKEGDVEVQIKK
ncbi:dCMP deaminase family protein [Patescibacteria group bacterium]|nr:dCMP deaminase family protein [Patescibacteria group bacterium]MBU1074493.1 dCMP deaminase family protein [Patescibacteria group bacterium]MBU1951618.1 dCMP deaminase family protein [Patescibacteria group bacterium]